MSSRSLHKRLSSRYLLLSLAVALIPLFIFAGLYDRYFEQLVSKITDGRMNTQVAAVQNEFKVYLRERLYQLDVLADELDSPEIFSSRGKENLSNELEALLRLQTDLNNVYGVAFFNSEKSFCGVFLNVRCQLNATFQSYHSLHFSKIQNCLGQNLIALTTLPQFYL